MQTNTLEYLSHSRIESYRSCSLRFQFQYIEKLKAAFVPVPLAFGVGFHRAVESALVALMSGAFPSVDELVAVIASSIDEQAAELPIRYSEKESREGLLAQAKAMLEAWAAWPRPEASILAVEHEFRIPLAEWGPATRVARPSCCGVGAPSSRGRACREGRSVRAAGLPIAGRRPSPSCC